MKKICYDPLWEILKKNNISKNKLRIEAKLSSSTFSKLINEENVTTNTLIKICGFLECDINEIICCKNIGENDL